MIQPDRTILSPNHYAGWPSGVKPKALFVHSTRSGQARFTDEQELQGTINWFLRADSQASAHWVISGSGEKVRMVPDEYPAWHAGSRNITHNRHAYGIELTQPTADRPYQDGHYRGLVEVCVGYVQDHGVPLAALRGFVNGDEGFVGHEDSSQGRSVGKSDPGPQFDWSRFMRELGAALVPTLPKEEDEMSQAQYDALMAEVKSTKPFLALKPGDPTVWVVDGFVERRRVTDIAEMNGLKYIGLAGPVTLPAALLDAIPIADALGGD